MRDAQPAWFVLDAGAALGRLQSAPEGLSPAEAARRLARFGANELQAARRVSPATILAAQFRSVLILILLAATAVSWALGQAVEALVIAVIVLFAVLLGFVQEFRAERALEALRHLAAPLATVLRGGIEQRVAARELVCGDVILLATGDRVAADARLLEAIGLELDEALLTGESGGVCKCTPPLAARADGGLPPPGDRLNMVFAGTSVNRGRGCAVVVATGMDTEFGAIAGMLAQVRPGLTPLQQSLDRLGAALGRAAGAVIVLIVLAGWLRGQPLLDMLLFGIALAVAVVPEALPAVVTISLALGVQKMVRRHVLVRRLAAVETLGSTSVILSDKTGTLTRDEMTVRELFCAGRNWHLSGAGFAPHGEFLDSEGAPRAPDPPLRELLRAAVLASDATLVRASPADGGAWQIKGDPTEGALVVAAAKAGLHRHELQRASPRIAERAFTAESRRMTTVMRAMGGCFACVKGAPEVVLAACDRQRGAGGSEVLDAEARAQLLGIAQDMAGRALRVLAVAGCAAESAEDAHSGLEFLGLVGLIDPPRKEAGPAVACCVEAGVRVVMITGDHPLTARAVARDLGLPAGQFVLSGDELDRMDDAELRLRIRAIGVFARVSPAHKLRVVDAWKAAGEVVAMTGDGVNDAPALKHADVGIAMGLSGTDVSREAAAITLTDDNFASIAAAVEEGRAVYANIRKYLMYLLSSNVGEIGLMAGATLLGLPLPLAAVQILYVNLATDGLPALALAVDPPAPDLMRRPPRDPRTGIFGGDAVALMLLGGAWSTLVNLGVFAWELRAGGGLAHAMSICFVSLVLIQLVKAYNFRSDRESVLRGTFANRWLNRAVLWEAVLLAAIVSFPALAGAFRVVALDAGDWALAVGAALSVAPVLEAGKWLTRKRAASAR